MPTTPFFDRDVWVFFVNFGDLGVLVPGAAIVAIGLFAFGRRRQALTWSIAFLLCAAATLGLKSAFGSFPSGHSSISAVFYGGLGWLAWSSRHPLGRALAMLLWAMVGVIALAVWALSWHHASDILSGLVVGAIFVALMATGGVARTPRFREAAALFVAAALVVASTHGTRVYYRLSPLAVAVIQL